MTFSTVAVKTGAGLISRKGPEVGNMLTDIAQPVVTDAAIAINDSRVKVIYSFLFP